MKIALDIRYRVRSGASSYIDGLVPQLVELAGDRIAFTLVAYDGQPMPPDLPDLQVIWAPMNSALSDMHWVNRKLPARLKAEGIDLFHVLKLFGPIRCPVPMVHTAQSITRQRLGEFPLTVKQRLLYGQYGAYVWRRSAAVIAVSEYVAEFVRDDLKIPADKVHRVYNGISQSFRDTITQAQHQSAAPLPGVGDKPFLLCVGNMEPVKNHLSAVRAFGEIADRVEHHLVIAGRTDKPCAREVEAEVEHLGLGDRVHYTGFIKLDVLSQYLCRADVLLHPSLSEGLSIAVLEAMYCGLPIVGSRIPGITEAAGEWGRYTDDPHDVSRLAELTLELLKDPETRAEVAAGSAERAAEFTWTQAARETLAVYDAALGLAPSEPSTS